MPYPYAWGMRQATENALLSLMFLVAITSMSHAAGTAGAGFLKMGAGARAAAMGETFTAISDDVTATYWNPAGLGQLENAQVSMMHNSGLIDSNYQYIGAGIPVGRNALGFSVYRLDHGSIERYTAADAKDGSFDAGSLAASFSVSNAITENLRIGFSGKYLRQNIEAVSATSFAGDFGLLYRAGHTSFGATVRHMGPGLEFVKEKASLPQTVSIGAARRFGNDKFLVALDLSKAKDNDLTYHGGLEYNVTNFSALRAGYQITPSNTLDVDGLTAFSGGVGLHFGLFTFDYAFIPFGDLGNTHRLSLSLSFKRS